MSIPFPDWCVLLATHVAGL